MSRLYNLINDAEAFYAPAPERFHNGRNQLIDLSGNFRHATPNGGTAIAENGYRDFGKIPLDGSDDEVLSPLNGFPDELTLAALIKTDSSVNDSKTDSAGIITNGNSGGITAVPSNGVISVQVDGGNNILFDGNGYNQFKSYNYGDEWVLFHVRFVANEYVEWGINTDTVDIKGLSSNPDVPVCARLGSDHTREHFAMDVAFNGAWSREVSDAELELLNNLTGLPRGYI